MFLRAFFSSMHFLGHLRIIERTNYFFYIAQMFIKSVNPMKMRAECDRQNLYSSHSSYTEIIDKQQAKLSVSRKSVNIY